MSAKTQKRFHFEIREIDAWNDEESGWIWNTSYVRLVPLQVFDR